MIKELDEDREESQDPEVEFAITGAVRECGGLEILLSMVQVCHWPFSFPFCVCMCVFFNFDFGKSYCFGSSFERGLLIKNKEAQALTENRKPKKVACKLLCLICLVLILV